MNGHFVVVFSNPGSLSIRNLVYCRTDADRPVSINLARQDKLYSLPYCIFLMHKYTTFSRCVLISNFC